MCGTCAFFVPESEEVLGDAAAAGELLSVSSLKFSADVKSVRLIKQIIASTAKILRCFWKNIFFFCSKTNCA